MALQQGHSRWLRVVFGRRGSGPGPLFQDDAVMAVWAVPWLELGGVGPHRRCIGPRPHQGRLAPVGLLQLMRG